MNKLTMLIFTEWSYEHIINNFAFLIIIGGRIIASRLRLLILHRKQNKIIVDLCWTSFCTVVRISPDFNKKRQTWEIRKINGSFIFPLNDSRFQHLISHTRDKLKLTRELVWSGCVSIIEKEDTGSEDRMAIGRSHLKEMRKKR